MCPEIINDLNYKWKKLSYPFQFNEFKSKPNSTEEYTDTNLTGMLFATEETTNDTKIRENAIFDAIFSGATLCTARFDYN